MSMELGSVAYGSTGNKTPTLSGSFTPTYIEFWITARAGTTETVLLNSKGTVDIALGNATATSNFADATHFFSKVVVGSSTGSPCVLHYALSGGVVTKIIEGTFVSAASGSFTINMTVVNASYDIYFKASS